MFYSKFMFVKKGPLAKVWIAAHFHRKLNKAHVQGSDIVISAKSILDPAAPIALRLSGQLLLGLVRIYQRKVKYLQEDCSDALTKIKMIFRAGPVDLPPDASIAQHNQITLPDNSERVDYAIPEMALETLDMILMKPFEATKDTGSDSLPRLDSFTASGEEITLKEPGLNLEDIDLLANGNEDLLPDGEHDIFGSDVLIQPLHGDKSASDVEMGRDAKETHQTVLEDFDIAVGDIQYAMAETEKNNDKSDSSSVIPADLSGLDTSTDAAKSDGPPQQKPDDASMILEDVPQPPEGFLPPDDGIDDGGEVVEMDLGQAPEAPGSLQQKPQKRESQKRKFAKRDERTELSGKIISAQLRDTSGITTVRDPIPMKKRSKLRHYYLNSGFEAMVQTPSTLPGVYAIQDTGFFAPELLDVFHRTSCLGELPVPLRELSEAELAKQAMEKQVREEMKAVEETPDGLGNIFGEDEKMPDDGPVVAEHDVTLQSATDGGDTTFGGADVTGDPLIPQEIAPEEVTNEIPDVPVEDYVPNGTKEVFEASEEFKNHLNDLGDEDKQLRDDIFGESSSESTKTGSTSEEKDDHETRYGWSRRTRKMHQWLDREMRDKEKLSFESLGDMSSKTAASVFYQLLVLKTHNYIHVEQEESYGDIVIAKDDFRAPVVVS